MTIEEYKKIIENNVYYHPPLETMIEGRKQSIVKKSNKDKDSETQETRLVCKFNVTDTNNGVPIMHISAIPQFSKIEIDGVIQPNIITSYQFNTTGEHVVKYTMIDNTTIGLETFYECRSLTSVIIPDTVTSIEEGAFHDCSNLTSVEFSNSITEISRSVFNGCYKLASFTIPESVTVIRRYAFSQCSQLRTIIIPNSVTDIEEGVFNGCSNLTSVTIGSSVTTIGTETFQQCSSLESIISLPMNAPQVYYKTFFFCRRNGKLYTPNGSTGYNNTWMRTDDYYLGKYNWTMETINI